MLDVSEDSPAFRPAEVGILTLAYRYALSYLDFDLPLSPSDRRCLARLTVLAGSARLRHRKGLDTFVDAHALSVEVVTPFLDLQWSRA